ncbi:MAG: acetylxylan esterase [Armatimonadetes bacterium]|nr:acetylxylan esterase [Armatimonadota bacterium]
MPVYLVLVMLMSCPRASSVPYASVMTEQEAFASLDATLNRYTLPRAPRAQSREEWERRKTELRQIVLDCLGLWPLPERVPLNVKIASERPGDGYTLKRIYWQVYPDVYASGWLYMPTGVAGKAPAVLCPHGHWDTGARHPTVQTRCIVLAQKGYVVLAVDSVHLDDYRIGINPVGLMTWNNIRAVDLLCSLPEVDPSRIGCTGASGGGQQAMYMMVVDDRIAAAAPTVMISYFFRIIARDVAHCYCNHVPSLARYTDEPEMCAAFAPKPALYMCDTQDWTRWFPHEGFPEIQAIYRLYGAEDRVECHQWDVGHDYTKAMRETMYRFFDRWLKGADHPVEPEASVKTLDPAEMLEMGPNSPTAEDLPKITSDYMARRAAKPIDWSRTAPGEKAVDLRRRFADLVGEHLGGEMPAVVEERGTASLDGMTVRRLVFQSEPGVQLPAVLAEPQYTSDRLRPVVLACPGGKAAAFEASGACQGACRHRVCGVGARLPLYGRAQSA